MTRASALTGEEGYSEDDIGEHLVRLHVAPRIDERERERVARARRELRILAIVDEAPQNLRGALRIPHRHEAIRRVEERLVDDRAGGILVRDQEQLVRPFLVPLERLEDLAALEPREARAIVLRVGLDEFLVGR